MWGKDLDRFESSGRQSSGLTVDRVMVVGAASNDLNAAFLTRTTAVVRNGGYILNQFDIQSRCLKRRDRTFATAAGALDSDFHITHSEFRCLLGGLLGRTLAGKGGAFSAAFESARSRTGPTQRVAFGVRNRDGRVIERRMNVRHTVGDIATNSFFLVGLGHRRLSKNSVVWGGVARKSGGGRSASIADP